MSGVFIAGTDTGVGKTYVSARLIRALVSTGLEVAAMKPIAAGAEKSADGSLRNEDAVELAQAANVVATYEAINPYCFPSPVSPHLAAREAGVRVELPLILQRYRELESRADVVVVEGAGGWHAPFSDTETMADLAIALRLPVLLVVGLRLGCLNHALLTVKAIREAQLPFAGWIGNAIDPGFALPRENIQTLEGLLGRSPLALLGTGEDFSGAATTRLTQALGFSRNLLS